MPKDPKGPNEPKASKAKTKRKTSAAAGAAGAEPEDETASGAGAGQAESKPHVEDRLDDFADRFSRAMSDGVKKMEDAFEKGMDNIKSNPKFQEGRLRGFFTSSAGGAILVIIGSVWFAYAVGLLSNWIIPLLIIALGAYLMHRYKSD